MLLLEELRSPESRRGSRLGADPGAGPVSAVWLFSESSSKPVSTPLQKIGQSRHSHTLLMTQMICLPSQGSLGGGPRPGLRVQHP